MADANEIVLCDPKLKANPYELYARLRREAPVCRARGTARCFWLVTRYDDVVFVLKDSGFATNRIQAQIRRSLIEKLILCAYRPLLTNMLGSDEPDHGRLRGLVNQAFTRRRIEQLRAHRSAHQSIPRSH
jgi:cytochrome P450